jgi:ketosteroid isomerase-like protein
MALTLGPEAFHSDAARLAQRAYEAFARRDLNTLGTILAEDVVYAWRNSVSVVTGAGRQALLAELARVVNDTHGTAAADLRHAYADTEGRVVCLHHESARFAGRLRERDSCLALTVASGFITAVVQLDEQPAPAAPQWRPMLPQDP